MKPGMEKFAEPQKHRQWTGPSDMLNGSENLSMLGFIVDAF